MFGETLSLNEPSVPYSSHMHLEYELYFLLQGEVDYIIGDSIYHIGKHDLLFIQPTVYHYPRLLGSTPYHRIIVNFSAEHLSDLPQPLDDYRPYYHIPSDNVIHTLYKTALDSIDRYDRQDVYADLRAYLNLILTELKYFDTEHEKNVECVHPLIGNVLQYINENIHRPLRVQTVAEQFYISPTWLTHAFKKYMNISVMQYVNRKKILTAHQLIQNGATPTDAAEQCGFENYTTFYLQYKKMFGASPRNL